MLKNECISESRIQLREEVAEDDRHVVSAPAREDDVQAVPASPTGSYSSARVSVCPII